MIYSSISIIKKERVKLNENEQAAL